MHVLASHSKLVLKIINDTFDTFIDVASDCKSYIVVVVVVLLRKSVVQNL